MRANLQFLKSLNFIGFGTDGDLDTTSSISFTSTLDGPTVYKYFRNIRINEGHIVNVANRCQGLVLYCFGDCIINGTLTMTARGANAAGALFAPNNLDKIFSPAGVLTNYSIAAAGGNGGNGFSAAINPGPYAYPGNNGSAGVNGACGGGGSGGNLSQGGSQATCGSGSQGTSFSGGAGGGAAATGGCGGVTGTSGASNGGAGGAGSAWNCSNPTYRCGAGGGAGNNGGGGSQSRYGYACTSESGGNGTGGLLVLIVHGRLIIGSTGIISANGVAGGSCNCNGNNGGGGGSGGGSITILYGFSYSNAGTVQANGGAGGTTYGLNGAGGAGGVGSIRISQMLL